MRINQRRAQSGGPKAVAEYFAERQAYTHAAQSFLHSHQFETELDRKIWELHAEGVAYRQIASTLGTYTRLVNDTVNRLRPLALSATAASTERRRGRPLNPHARSSQGSGVLIAYRLSEHEAELLAEIADANERKLNNMARSLTLVAIEACRRSGRNKLVSK